MVEYKLAIGDILTLDSIEYRIIHITMEEIVLCEMNIETLFISTVNFDAFNKLLEDGKVMLKHEEVSKVVDTSKLSLPASVDFEMRSDIVRKVTENYGPDFTGLMSRKHKTDLLELREKYNIDKKSFLRIIRRYLQSGLSETSLLNLPRGSKDRDYKSKPGSKGKYGAVSQYIVTEETVRNFQSALDWYKSGRERSFRKAYDKMNGEYYSVKNLKDGVYTCTLLPLTERPSYKQFYYWCHNNLPADEKMKIKTSRREFRNNNRLLTGDASWNAVAPGELVLVDALEVDTSLISLVDYGQTVGRPIVYGMRDAVTHAVVAVSVSYENNSTLGWSNLMLNLCEDKKELCERYGIKVDNIEKVWPSNFLPHTMLSDHGADFKSLKVKKILSSLNVTRDLAPVATGSMKGLIEQWFHQIHADLLSHLEGHGMITGRYDSKHHQQATLTITEFTKMLYIHLIAYNQKHMDDFKPTSEMMEDKIDATPMVLWEYLCRRKGSPRPIPNKLDYMFKFLSTTTAKINKSCIIFPKYGLRYLDPSDHDLIVRMVALGPKKANLEIMYDPRDTSKVYYLDKDNNVHTAELLDIPWMQSLKGCTFKEVENYDTSRKEANAEARQRNEQIATDVFSAEEKIVQTAAQERRDNKPTADNLLSAREDERARVNREQSLVNKIEAEKAPERKEIEQPATVKTADTDKADKVRKSDGFEPKTEEEIDRAYMEALEDLF